MQKSHFKIAILLSIAGISFLLTTIVYGSNVHTYYVSTSYGDDNNPGTESLPFRTIKRALKECVVDSLLLKKGDVFYESINGLKNCYIGAYGKGDMPVLCGFLVIKPNESLWSQVSDSIWRIDLRNLSSSNLGFKESNASEPDYFYNIGSIYHINNDKVYGHLVKKKDKLLNNGDFYTTSLHQKKDFKDTTLGFLYLRWPENPAHMGGLGLTPYNGAIYNLRNCKVENIAVVGFNYGIYYISYTDVINCKFDVIGGGIHIGREIWCRCGNGIELWEADFPRDNVKIQGCHFSRIYDCGMTIQGVGKTKNVQNVIVDNCIFVNCRQAFEHFITNDKYSPHYDNCKFYGNICIFMGDNGFDSPIKREANLLSYETEPVNIEISKNIFYGGNHYCARYVSENMKNNQIYLYDNQYLLYPIIGSSYNNIILPTEDGIKEYRKLTGDNSAIHVIEKGSKLDDSLQTSFLSNFSYTAPLIKNR